MFQSSTKHVRKTTTFSRRMFLFRVVDGARFVCIAHRPFPSAGPTARRSETTGGHVDRIGRQWPEAFQSDGTRPRLPKDCARYLRRLEGLSRKRNNPYRVSLIQELLPVDKDRHINCFAWFQPLPVLICFTDEACFHLSG
jgi:hypothetical protein